MRGAGSAACSPTDADLAVSDVAFDRRAGLNAGRQVVSVSAPFQTLEDIPESGAALMTPQICLHSVKIVIIKAIRLSSVEKQL